MVCKPPYEMIEGLGCLWLYWRTGHTFDEGFIECQKTGGDFFETTNWNQQQIALHDYLIAKGG